MTSATQRLINNARVDPAKYKPGAQIKLPAHIRKAMKAGKFSRLRIRNWRPLPLEDLTEAERGMRFLEEFVIVPSGIHVGKPLRLLLFQEMILYAMFDLQPSTFILTMARRNGKTLIMALVVLIFMASYMAKRNSLLASAAMSRDQAALIYRELKLIIEFSPMLRRVIKSTDSAKRMVGVARNAEYSSLSSEAKSGFGRSFQVLIFDECGQVVGAESTYLSMLHTSQGSTENPVFAAISTQAPSDADYLSVMIDTAIRDQPPDTVAVVFATDKEAELDDEVAWFDSNPGLGVFRSLADMRKQARNAIAIPEVESRFRNLNLNQRVSSVGLWLSAEVWRKGADKIDMKEFSRVSSALALDLSTRTDLTAAVFAAKDEAGRIHLLPLVFTPTMGLEQRELRDKVPYRMWAEKGFLHLTPGSFVSYEWVSEFLVKFMEEHSIEPALVVFDRWRIEDFKIHAERAGLAPFAEWRGVGQGYKDMSPRVEMFEGKLLAGDIRHGSHPLLNMAAASAISTRDPSGNRKLDKSKATQRIDPLVAAIMALFEAEQADQLLSDPAAWVIA